LFRESDEYTIIFTTWDTEDTSIITNKIPSAIINKIKQPTKEEFNEWFLEHSPLNYFKYKTSMSEISEEENKNRLYMYFLQIYTWKKSAEFIESIHSKTSFDLLISLRPDIILNKNISEYYDLIKKNTIYFASIPYYMNTNKVYKIFLNYAYQDDTIFMGDISTCLHILKLIDYIDYLKLNDICPDKYEWKDCLHPETILQLCCVLLNINQENIEGLKVSLIR